MTNNQWSLPIKEIGSDCPKCGNEEFPVACDERRITYMCGWCGESWSSKRAEVQPDYHE